MQSAKRKLKSKKYTEEVFGFKTKERIKPEKTTKSKKEYWTLMGVYAKIMASKADEF